MKLFASGVTRNAAFKAFPASEPVYTGYFPKRFADSAAKSGRSVIFLNACAYV